MFLCGLSCSSYGFAIVYYTTILIEPLQSTSQHQLFNLLDYLSVTIAALELIICFWLSSRVPSILLIILIMRCSCLQCGLSLTYAWDWCLSSLSSLVCRGLNILTKIDHPSRTSVFSTCGLIVTSLSMLLPDLVNHFLGITISLLLLDISSQIGLSNYYYTSSEYIIILD